MLDFPKPPNVAVGDLYPDPAIEGLPQWVWDGERWMPAISGGSGVLSSSGGTISGDLAVSGVLRLAGDPVDPLDAATKRYVDDEVEEVNDALADYLPLAGGAVTGALTVGGALTLADAPTADLEAATKKYVDDEVAQAGGGAPGTTLVANLTSDFLVSPINTNVDVFSLDVGNEGTWFVTANTRFVNTSITTHIYLSLIAGSTTFAYMSSNIPTAGAQFPVSASFAGVITNPQGPIRFQANVGATNTYVFANSTKMIAIRTA